MTNLMWSAFHVATIDVATSFLSTIEDWIEPNLMTYDIWRHSIVALIHVGCGRKVSYLLHLLSTPQLKLERDAIDNLLFGTHGGKGKGYYDVEAMIDYDYETISSLPFVILRDVMHDV